MPSNRLPLSQNHGLERRSLPHETGGSNFVVRWRLPNQNGLTEVLLQLMPVTLPPTICQPY
jgi:hypothetical protein